MTIESTKHPLAVSAAIAMCFIKASPENVQQIMHFVDSITNADTYTGMIALVPLTATKAESFTVTKDPAVFRKFTANSNTSDVFQDEEGTEWRICTYSVRDEERIRVAVYSEAATFPDFFVRYVKSESALKKMQNSPHIIVQSEHGLKTAEGPEIPVMGYNTDSSHVKRIAIVAPDADFIFNSDWVEEIGSELENKTKHF